MSHSRWFPFADPDGGRLSRRQWLLLAAAFVAWHIIGVLAARAAGSYTGQPNSDHTPYMREVLERGYPTPSLWPPGFSYYLAFKWALTQAVGLPYAASKYLVDVWLVAATGLLSVALGLQLTRNRTLAVAAGVVQLGAPIFILGVGMEEAAIFSQPLYLLSMWMMVREWQREAGPRPMMFAGAGAVMGLATLIRSNTQFVVVVVFLFSWWLLRAVGRSRAWARALVLAVAFWAAGGVVGMPWAMWQRRHAESGVFAFGGIYRAYFKGLTRHRGNHIGDWVTEHYKEPERTPGGVVRFNLEWMRKDPVAFVQLYVLKFVRAWYMSDSGRWDRATLLLHLPIWIAAVVGLRIWRRLGRGDPAWAFMLGIIVYMWSVSAILDGIARYSAPLYGFIGTFAGLAYLALRKRLPAPAAEPAAPPSAVGAA